ncbi:MAG: NAD-binding protein, partial [Dehalococcoidia bacterium]
SATRAFYQREESAKGGAAAEAGERVLLVGYGTTGEAVARVLRAAGVEFVALDMNADRVHQGQLEGMPLRFGDASRRATLEAAGGAACRAAVIAINDRAATRRAVAMLRSMNDRARILVRSRRVEEIDELESLGADEVISGEFEASVELFARLLTNLGVPRHVARVQESIIRMDHYGTMRGTASSKELLPEIESLIRGGTLETAQVMEGSYAAGRRLSELDLRRGTGASVLTLVRDEVPISNPDGATRLEAGDMLVIYGPHAAIDGALRLLEPRLADESKSRDSGGGDD